MKKTVLIALGAFGLLSLGLYLATAQTTTPLPTAIGPAQFRDAASSFDAFYVITPSGRKYYRPDSSIVFDDVNALVKAVIPPATQLPTRQSKTFVMSAPINPVISIADVPSANFGVEVRRNGLVNYSPQDYTLLLGTGIAVTYPANVLQINDLVEVVYFK